MMRILIALNALAALLVVPAVVVCLETNEDRPLQMAGGLWGRLDSEWKSAPLEVGYSEYTARARFLRLHDDGQMSLLVCLLRRAKSGTALSPADGYVLYRGSWQTNEGKLFVRYVKAEEMIPSSDPPFATFHETVLSREGRTILLGDVEFSEGDLILLSDYDAFVKRVPSVRVPSKRGQP